jgi:hypothetical protein
MTPKIPKLSKSIWNIGLIMKKQRNLFFLLMSQIIKPYYLSIIIDFSSDKST